jgi:peroxiredoxin
MKWFSSILGRGTGGQKMAALEPGTTAQAFMLSTIEGKQFSLQEALAQGPVLLAFFKVSCPTCQYAFPFLQRLFLQRLKQAHGNMAFTLVGVSQNGKKDTAAFLKECGITFPVLLDDTSSYPVSNAYGLTNVPTVFWIAADGEIEISSVGWVRKDMEEFNRRAAQVSSQTTLPLFHPGERIADFRAG